MNTGDLLIYTMCAIMIIVGIVIIRISPRERGMGAVAIVLGVIGFIAYQTAEEGAPPPPETTPTVVEANATVDSTPDTMSTP